MKPLLAFCGFKLRASKYDKAILNLGVPADQRVGGRLK